MPLFQETPVERRTTMEVEDANPLWDARENEIINGDAELVAAKRRNLGRN